MFQLGVVLLGGREASMDVCIYTKPNVVLILDSDWSEDRSAGQRVLERSSRQCNTSQRLT